MKRRVLLVAGGAPLALAAYAITTTVVAAAPPTDLDPFYEPLSPYEEWWWNEHHGWVWSPIIGPGWRR
jgi:hypothetical protein